MSVPLWASTARGALIGAVTIADVGNTVTLPGNTLAEGQQIMFAALTGGAATELVEGAPYWVRGAGGDSFQVAPSPGGPTMTFSADGTANAHEVAGLYSPAELRNTFAGLLGRGDHSGAFSARTGLFPNAGESAHLLVNGTSWETPDLNGVVRHVTGHTFQVSHVSDSGSVPAAEANPRIDAVDLRVNVHEFDGSNTVETELVYVTGVAEALPSEPGITESSERVGTILVPSTSEAEAPSVNSLPKFTTAVGGTVPVIDSSQYPVGGNAYKGLLVWDIELGALVVNTDAGSTYETLASTQGYRFYEEVQFTSSGTFNKADYPGIRAVEVQAQAGGAGGAGCDATGVGEASVSGGGGAGEWTKSWITADELPSSVSVTVGLGGSGGTSGAEQGGFGGNTSFGSLCTAIGGEGGFRRAPTTSFNAATGGVGGFGGIGDIRIQGGSGGAGIADARGTEGGVPGQGGDAQLSGVSRQGRGSSGSTGSAGQRYGGGGGGACNTESQAGRTGAGGAPGIVIVRIYV